jgi:hypothetical protein
MQEFSILIFNLFFNENTLIILHQLQLGEPIPPPPPPPPRPNYNLWRGFKAEAQTFGAVFSNRIKRNRLVLTWNTNKCWVQCMFVCKLYMYKSLYTCLSLWKHKPVSYYTNCNFIKYKELLLHKFNTKINFWIKSSKKSYHVIWILHPNFWKI